MRVTHDFLTAASLGLAAILTLGCDNSSGPTVEATGTIRVTVSTVGATNDLDRDGYRLSVDDATGQAIGLNNAVTIADLPVGNHLIRLDGLAPNCMVNGANPRSVDVTAGTTALRPLVVAFYIQCIPITGRVRVSLATTGPDPDTDGYTVLVGGRGGSIPTNGTLVIEGLREGQHGLSVSGVAGNCFVDEPRPATVTVTFGTTAEVALAIRCVSAGAILVTVTTAGVAPDLNGYRVEARLQTSGSSTSALVPANGTVPVSSLLPGNYVLTLHDMAPNCDLAVAGPHVVAVAAGSPTPVTVNVLCEEPPLLAFVTGSGVHSDIFVVNSNGTGERRLTFTPGADVNPAWSPDGSKIAFSSQRGFEFDIYVMSANGDGLVQLTSAGGADFDPAWSPDGTRITFVSTRDGNNEIYVMNADGTGPVRLTSHNASDSDPAWSPDGKRIAFESERDGLAGIWTMNADGSGVSRVTSNTDDRQPAWSPDGTRIAFSRRSGSNTRSIFVVNADGSNTTRLTDFENADGPSWSPDGRKIAFARLECDYYYYYYCDSILQVVRTDGIPYSRTTTNGLASEPAWRPGARP